nr:TonB-dependent receptor [Brevundimonas diminuta]
MRRLSFTAALRYEKYKNGEAATPKFGAVFEPIEDIQLKTSWGRSFKAPTLYQRFVITRARVSPEALYGFPGAGTVIALSGGNPDLKNEKAKSWTVSAEAKPRFIKGLRVEVSYFRVDYRDRVVRAPVLPSAGVYANPSYRDLITLDPSVAQIEQALALSPLPPTNGAGRPYDPADVVAIIDGRSVNISRQKISGVDFAGVYELPDVADGTLTLVAVSKATMKMRTVFDPNPEFQNIALQPAKRLYWRSAQGLDAYGDLILPPGHRLGQKHPLIIVGYNTVRGFHRGGMADEYPIQIFAANGFAVLSYARPNPPSGTDLATGFKASMNNWTDRRRIHGVLEAGRVAHRLRTPRTTIAPVSGSLGG